MRTPKKLSENEAIEAKLFLKQADRLEKLALFLSAHHAPAGLFDAVEQAMYDNDAWGYSEYDRRELVALLKHQ